MEDLEENSSGSTSSSGSAATEVDLEKVCFICLETGDPINNKLKKVTAEVLGKSASAIEERNKRKGSRKSIDTNKIRLPENLQKNNKYHQACFRDLTNLSGKKKIVYIDENSQTATIAHEEEPQRAEDDGEKNEEVPEPIDEQFQNPDLEVER